MRIRNRVIYSTDQDYLYRLRDEYRDYGGYDTLIGRGKLIVFAIPRAARKERQRKREERKSAKAV